MTWKVLLLPLLLVGLTGCVSSTKEVNSVKSYKSVNKYSTISIAKAENSDFLSQKLQDKFEDVLFEKLYTEKGVENFIPGDQLRLTYEVVNLNQLNKSLTDWGTYFGKENTNFEVLFTIYDKYNQEIGMYHLDIDVEYWLFPSDDKAVQNSFETASFAVAKYLKANYLK